MISKDVIESVDNSLNHRYPAAQIHAPEMGTVYYVPSIGDEDKIILHTWTNSHKDIRRLAHRLVHLEFDAAAAHAEYLVLSGGGDINHE